MKKDLGDLLERAEETRKEIRSFGKRSANKSIEPNKNMVIKLNGKSHTEEEDIDEQVQKLGLSNVDPNIHDDVHTGKD